MGFLNALGEIRRNKKLFKDWEQNNSDKDMQRKVLAQQNPIKDEDLKKAAAKGKVIMDAINIMDTHSEDVAENTETAIMPIASLAPIGAISASGFGVAKFLISPASKKHNEAYRNFLENEGKEVAKIYKTLSDQKWGMNNSESLQSAPEIKKLRLYGTDSLFNKKNIEILANSQNKELRDYANTIISKKAIYEKIPDIKNFKSKTIIGVAAIAAIGLISFIYSNVKAAKLQVQSSRVARWQSRKDLEDPKYFVQYTQEQVENAKKRLDENEKQEKNKGILPLFKKDNGKLNRKSGILTLGEVLKDNKNYKEWKKEYNQEDKKIKRDLSSEEIEEAKKDQEVIQRVTKQINNKAEEYSENMETTGGVLIGSTPFLGAAIGGLVAKLFNVTGIGEKISQKSFNSFIKDIDPKHQESAKKLFETINNSSKEKIGIFSRLKNGAQYFEEISDIAQDTLFSSKSADISKASILTEGLKKIKTLMNGILATNKGRGILIGIIGTALTGFAGSLIGLKLQKNSARAGRYIAKREVESDPYNFVGYSDKDFEKVKNIKAQPKTIGQKFVNYITFLPRVIKEYFEYEKYNRTEAKYKRKLMDEMVKSEVSDKQLKEAKNLQRKLFTTFENVDDKSQEYSESVEATCEMMQPLIPCVGIALFAIPLAAAVVKIYKGGAPKTIESITGFFAKHKDFLNKKWLNKYSQEVVENISTIVKRQEYISDDVQKMPLVNFLKLFSNNEKTTKGIMQAIKGKDNELKALLEYIAQNSSLKNMPKEQLLKALKGYGVSLPKSEAITGAMDVLTNTISNSKASTAGEIIDDLIQNHSDKIPNFNISKISNIKEVIISVKDSLLNAIKKSIGKDDELKSALEILSDDKLLKNLSKKDLTQLVNKIMKTIPDEVFQAGGITKVQIAELIESTDYENTAELIKNILNEYGDLLKGIKISNYIPAIDKIKNLGFSTESLSKLGDDIKKTNFSSVIGEFAEDQIKKGNARKILSQLVAEDKLPDSLKAITNKLLSSSMTDEQAANICKNIGIILKNIPKEDIDKILKAMFSEFKNNPDKFMEALRSGELPKFFATRGIQTAAVVATGSWAAISLLFTFTLESTLASIQKRAGRLGVMKALEDLNDVSYYANSEANNTGSIENVKSLQKVSFERFSQKTHTK